MFRKGLFKHSYCSFIHYSFKEMLTGVDQNWPKVPSLSGSFFPNKIHSQSSSSFYSQSSSQYETYSISSPRGSTKILVKNFCLVGIGSTSTDRFPTLKYESPTHIEDLPTLFHMGCHITSSAMARTWLHRNASLQTQLSAPAKLSDLTHSYGQNITVLSRQPTDSKVSALAKSCVLLP